MFTTKQNYKGLWEITIKEANGYFIKEVRTFTTKKAMLEYIKKNLN